MTDAPDTPDVPADPATPATGTGDTPVTPIPAKTTAKAPTKPTSPKAAPTAVTAAPAPPGHSPQAPYTLAIDIGGTGLKASVLDATGAMVADRVAVKTTYPCSPSTMVDDLAAVGGTAPAARPRLGRVPGHGPRPASCSPRPHFVTEHGPGTAIDAEAGEGVGRRSTSRRPSSKRLRQADPGGQRRRCPGLGGGDGQGPRAGRHARHRCGDRLLLRRATPAAPRVRPPSLLEGRHLQRAARRRGPQGRRQPAVEQAGAQGRRHLRALSFFDHCYIGGGNAKKIHGCLGSDVSMVDNSAGILGGIRLWDESHIGV